jgi:hypothetical protein
VEHDGVGGDPNLDVDLRSPAEDLLTGIEGELEPNGAGRDVVGELDPGRLRQDPRSPGRGRRRRRSRLVHLGRPGAGRQRKARAEERTTRDPGAPHAFFFGFLVLSFEDFFLSFGAVAVFFDFDFDFAAVGLGSSLS